MEQTKPPSEDPRLLALFDSLPLWGRVMLACIAAAAILIAAVVIGSKYYYQVNPLGGVAALPAPPTPDSVLPPDQMPSDQTPPDLTPYVLPFDKALAKAVVDDMPAGSCDSLLAINSRKTIDLSTSTIASLGQSVCSFIAKQGVGTIRHPLLTASSSDDYMPPGSYEGVGIVENGRTYLVTYGLNLGPDFNYHLTITHIALLETANAVTLNLVFIKTAVFDANLLHVASTDMSGQQSDEYFGQWQGRYSDNTYSEPVVKNDDGSYSNEVFSIADFYNPEVVSFLVPYAPWQSLTTSDIDYSMGTKPVYHKASCGLEEGYSDVAFNESPYQVIIGINFGRTSTLPVTTQLQGYDPQQWGKILYAVSMADFRKLVQSPKAYNSNAAVEMLKVAGFTVKHIGPITPNRDCQALQQVGTTYDMYQAIKNGAVITFIRMVSKGESNAPTPDQMHALIGQVLTTLEFSPQ